MSERPPRNRKSAREAKRSGGELPEGGFVHRTVETEPAAIELTFKKAEETKREEIALGKMVGEEVWQTLSNSESIQKLSEDAVKRSGSRRETPEPVRQQKQSLKFPELFEIYGDETPPAGVPEMYGKLKDEKKKESYLALLREEKEKGDASTARKSRGKRNHSAAQKPGKSALASVGAAVVSLPGQEEGAIPEFLRNDRNSSEDETRPRAHRIDESMLSKKTDTDTDTDTSSLSEAIEELGAQIRNLKETKNEEPVKESLKNESNPWGTYGSKRKEANQELHRLYPGEVPMEVFEKYLALVEEQEENFAQGITSEEKASNDVASFLAEQRAALGIAEDATEEAAEENPIIARPEDALDHGHMRELLGEDVIPTEPRSNPAEEEVTKLDSTEEWMKDMGPGWTFTSPDGKLQESFKGSSETADKETIDRTASGEHSIESSSTEEWMKEMGEGWTFLPPELTRKSEGAQVVSVPLSETVGEGAPEQWREKLRGLVAGAKERFGFSERGENLQGYLAGRTDVLDTKAKEYGPKVEKFIRSIGEKYNKLSLKSKIAVGVSLGIGAAAFSGVSAAAAFAFASGLVAQRAAGMAGMFLKFEKHLQDTAEGTSEGFLGRRKWYQNMFMGSSDRQRKVLAAMMSVAYTGAMSATIGEAVHVASESAWGEATHEWLKEHWPFGHTPETSNSGREVVGKIHPAAMGEVASMPEMPTVSATSGHGYEYMMKQLWQQLQEKHVTLPASANPHSDLARLLSADSKSIDSVVHQIASNPQHAFFHADGSSVSIQPNAQMTIDAQGELHLGTPGHDYLSAPAHAPVTPPSHPEVSAAVAPHPEASTSVTETPLPTVSHEVTPAAGGLHEQPPAPIETAVPSSVHEQGYLVDSRGVPVVDSQGTPVHTGSYEASHENTPSPAEHATPSPETATHSPSVSVEHAAQFVNNNGVSIDPTQGHIFQDVTGINQAYGNDFAERFDAAQEFVKAHHDAVVWVQSEKPVFFENQWRPWVFQVRFSGFGPFGSVQAILPTGLPDASQIGAIDPETFIKQLDK
ncbi:MAG: hypothetical protein ACYCZZ_01055 [Minisyncoccota bacterium]